jgi:hypothetical protein
MRLFVAVLSAIVLAAGCTGHPPAQTPVTPWSADRGTPAPASSSGASASASAGASASPAGGPNWDWTCQPDMPTDSPANWVAVAPEGAGFSVMLPGPELAATTNITTPAGDAPMHTWAFMDGCGRTFGVAKVSFPAGALPKAGSTTQVIDTAIDFQLQGQGAASVTARSDVSVSGSPARRYTISGADYVTDGLVVVVADDVYMAMISSGTDRQLPADALDAFFATFSLG